MACSYLCYLNKLTCLNTYYTSSTHSVTVELLEAQKKINDLQSELIKCKEEKMEAMKTVVHSSVAESVKEEFKSYSSVVKSHGRNETKEPLSQATLKKVVQDVVQEEDRSKNVMAFGLEEGENEDISAIVNELLNTMEEKPRVEACRVGMKKTSGKVRPVKITTVSSSVADQIIAKGRNLNCVDKYKKVFVNPDRSPEQREERRELVKEVKRLSVEDKDKRHYIRNGKVCSVARNTS